MRKLFVEGSNNSHRTDHQHHWASIWGSKDTQPFLFLKKWRLSFSSQRKWAVFWFLVISLGLWDGWGAGTALHIAFWFSPLACPLPLWWGVQGPTPRILPCALSQWLICFALQSSAWNSPKQGHRSKHHARETFFSLTSCRYSCSRPRGACPIQICFNNSCSYYTSLLLFLCPNIITIWENLSSSHPVCLLTLGFQHLIM